MMRQQSPLAAARRRRKLPVAVCLLVVLVAGVYALARSAGLSPSPERGAQAGPPSAKGRGRNLALQPAAFGLGRRLGQRFLKGGREVSVLEGALTDGLESRRVVVRRVQDEGGEQVEVAVAGRGAPITWDSVNGAFQAGRPADAAGAALAERLAMDSPDQFVLAQLRGASYLVVARGVRADEGGGDGYSGPLHDVVRVGEPRRGEDEGTSWRLYYVDTRTGLLDKVVSEEGGERVEATLSGWREHGGEWQPSRVTWSRGGQTFMVLALANAAHGPKQ